jgi:hypothetical protein
MKSHLFLYALCLSCAGVAIAQGTTGYVAGLHPYQRPVGAPQLTEAVRSPEQVERALHGIENPIPGNVESIAVVGNWWVPLRQPGMSYPYDLRNWHDAKTAKTDSSSTPSSAAPLER